MKLLLLIISFYSFAQPVTVEKTEIEDNLIYLKGFNQFNDRISSFTSFNTEIPVNANSLNTYFNELNIRGASIYQFSSNEILKKENIDNNLDTLLSEYRLHEEAKSPITLTTANHFLWDWHSNRGVYSFKLTKSDYVKVDLISINDSNLKCANGEYCSFDYNVSNVGSKDLGRFKGVRSDGSSQFFNLYSHVENVYLSPPYRTTDYGCANADTFSASKYNIWTCDGSGENCDRFCYNGSCMDGSNPASLFNSKYNNGNMVYSSWSKASGDLRSGCSGKYVYAVKVNYYYRKFNIRKNEE